MPTAAPLLLQTVKVQAPSENTVDGPCCSLLFGHSPDCPNRTSPPSVDFDADDADDMSGSTSSTTSSKEQSHWLREQCVHGGLVGALPVTVPVSVGPGAVPLGVHVAKPAALGHGAGGWAGFAKLDLSKFVSSTFPSPSPRPSNLPPVNTGGGATNDEGYWNTQTGGMHAFGEEE